MLLEVQFIAKGSDMATAMVLGPEEMITRWQQALPDAVIEAFNEELTKRFDGKSASIREKNLVDAIAAKGIESKVMTEQRWLKQTVELYKERGWKVAERDCGDDYSYDIYYNFSVP